MAVLALDTSNYTTSAAVLDGAEGCNVGRLLAVRPGELGLRQSDALFQHVKALPQIFSDLRDTGLLHHISAVGASTRPRAVEGSYMPCFWAGTAQGQALACTLDVPFFSCSHQQGHLAAAAFSAGRMELLDRPFLAWHLSGGTTELLSVRPEGCTIAAEVLGGTSDISAGQLIDRTGVLLGLPFPAGRALDELAGGAPAAGYRVKVKEYSFSLSGMENKVRQRAQSGEDAADTARFALDTVIDAVERVTLAALERWPGTPVLFSGGVAANRRLRARMAECPFESVFAEPRYSTDNAMGVAVLTDRALRGGILR